MRAMIFILQNKSILKQNLVIPYESNRIPCLFRQKLNQFYIEEQNNAPGTISFFSCYHKYYLLLFYYVWKLPWAL